MINNEDNIVSLDIYGTEKCDPKSTFFAKLVDQFLINSNKKIKWENLFIFFPGENWDCHLGEYMKVSVSELADPLEGENFTSSKTIIKNAIIETFIVFFPNLKKLILQYGNGPCRVIYKKDEKEANK